MRKLLIRTLSQLSKLPIIGKTFWLYLAAAAAGDSARAIQAEQYKYAFHIVQRFEGDEIDDPYLSRCQYHLGYLLFRGLGTEKDTRRAIVVLERAASNGSRNAIDFMRQRSKRLEKGETGEHFQPNM